jgi:hypothetical protein
MDTFNLILGLTGTIASVLSLFYAALAARRSEALLRRLVVYPFRELDVAFARLTTREQSVVQALYDRALGGSVTLTERVLDNVSTEFPDAGPAMMAFLERENWLRRGQGGVLEVNPDRTPYMTFLAEVESEGRNHDKDR